MQIPSHIPNSTNPSDLFTYGSLMCADIMAQVVGAQLHSSSAVLSGYQRFVVRGEQYPGIVAHSGGKVAGRVYHGITQVSWERLDRFEGEMYERQQVVVSYQNGRKTEVDCYVIRPEFINRLTTIEWDFDTFLRSGKAQFQDQYGGFNAIAE
jgi:gamma-glutamylcyclotransferase (GGCT)/AIG2-like uncharacterized protein YtfP